MDCRTCFFQRALDDAREVLQVFGEFRHRSAIEESTRWGPIHERPQQDIHRCLVPMRSHVLSGTRFLTATDVQLLCR